MLTPRRSNRAYPVADLGGVPDGGGADDGNVVPAPPIPPPPVLDDEREEQMDARRNLRADALSLDHMLTHKPSNKYWDFCMRGNMRDVHKFKGAFSASPHP
eukprot:15128192-Heterocapsa_arctica.AAC.1